MQFQSLISAVCLRYIFSNFSKGYQLKKWKNLSLPIHWSGMDPGFPVGERANLRMGRGEQHTILPNFPKSYIKLRKMLGRVGG